MGLFPAIAISIVVVVIIIIIVVVAAIVSNGGGKVSSEGECSTQSDCNPGYVCVREQEKDTSSSNKCKAGLGTSCSSDSDCAPEFVCQSSGQFKRYNTTSGKVCSRKPSDTNTRSPDTSGKSSRVKRRNLTVEHVAKIPDPTRSTGVIQGVSYPPCPKRIPPVLPNPQQQPEQAPIILNKVSEQEKLPQTKPESPIEAAERSRFSAGRMYNEVSSFRPLIPSFTENRNISSDGDIDTSLSPLGRNYFGKVPMTEDNFSSRTLSGNNFYSNHMNKGSAKVFGQVPRTQQEAAYLDVFNTNMRSITSSHPMAMGITSSNTHVHSGKEVYQGNSPPVEFQERRVLHDNSGTSDSPKGRRVPRNQYNAMTDQHVTGRSYTFSDRASHTVDSIHERIPIISDKSGPLPFENTRTHVIQKTINGGMSPSFDVAPSLYNNRTAPTSSETRRIVSKSGDVTPLIDMYDGRSDIIPTEIKSNGGIIDGSGGRSGLRKSFETSTRASDGSLAQNIMGNLMRGHERYGRNISTDGTSTDYEVNSDGALADAFFDVRSGESTRDGQCDIITSVSTPCEMKDGVYYCRNDKSCQDIEGLGQHSSPVVDVCSYSSATVFLLEDGSIICDTEAPESKRYRASNNIRLTRITSFNGYLYGVGEDRKLYTLPNSSFSTSVWIWNSCDWAPDGIIHVSSTHDSTHIWVQTETSGYVYNNPSSAPVEIPYTNGKRVYGRDVNHYIDIDTTRYTAKITPGDTIIHNVYDGALSYYDEVVAIHPSERSEYRTITIVNWRPYYIRA